MECMNMNLIQQNRICWIPKCILLFLIQCVRFWEASKNREAVLLYSAENMKNIGYGHKQFLR